MEPAQVMVVGSGPTGLWLACELSLAGVSVEVLERDAVRSTKPKAITLHSRSLEVLAMRGLADRFLSSGPQLPTWHLGMLEARLPLNRLDTPYPFVLSHDQVRTEEKLQERALELGVRLLREHVVTGLEQDEDQVRVKVGSPAGEQVRTAQYVVGCDGANSVVRRSAGIEFPGVEASFYGYLAELTLDDPPAPGFGVHSEQGSMMAVPVGPGGRYRLFGYDPAHQDASPLTFEQVRECAIRLAGSDFGMREAGWLSRFGSAHRVAARYRDRRVLLAGDAAHRHFPAGGVGLNVGLQDAMNLGWKLAAHLQGRASADLLDTYDAERQPVGAELVESTLAQTALLTAVTPEGIALRGLVGRLIRTQPEMSLALAGQLAAVDVAYPVEGGHRLVGARVPGPVSVLDRLRTGKPLVLNLSGQQLRAATGRAKWLKLPMEDVGRELRPEWAGVAALVIRPDGHIWAAVDESPRAESALIDALNALPARF